MPSDTPTMLVVDGTRATEEQHFTTLANLGEVAAKMDAKRPTLIVIGRVVDLADALVSAESEALDRVGHG